MTSWKGIAFGSLVGSLTGIPFGFAIGAFVGYQIEKALSDRKRHSSRVDGMPNDRMLAFCASAAAMLAKLAKADGHVSEHEIAAVERAFARLGFSAEARRYAVRIFRKAKDDHHSIYDYAVEFALATPSIEVREVFYGILWDLARADGRVSAEERLILANIPRYLQIRPDWFAAYDEPSRTRSSESSDDAYAVLGVSPSVSDEDVKRAYREKAKKYHPDALRAQGLPDEMIGRATEQMKRLNAAWATIRAKRGL